MRIQDIKSKVRPTGMEVEEPLSPPPQEREERTARKSSTQVQRSGKRPLLRGPGRRGALPGGAAVHPGRGYGARGAGEGQEVEQALRGQARLAARGGLAEERVGQVERAEVGQRLRCDFPGPDPQASRAP